MTIDVNNEVK